ncbi:uncharacterized protein EKO05_0011460 [Ascochyta rabiei]|uniref:uncharacterized protein n=1 Tax=Didymella rabiei TaxID=5454 RepID=UPI0021F97F8E|nr:uncharacterized protein EKO05_0011460 [Ascochyta rabiei]UPX21269.1 hypothetical protein EKO05_0011460 [Ascochyta rabiei]
MFTPACPSARFRSFAVSAIACRCLSLPPLPAIACHCLPLPAIACLSPSLTRCAAELRCSLGTSSPVHARAAIVTAEPRSSVSTLDPRPSTLDRALRPPSTNPPPPAMSYYNDPTWPAPAPGRQSSWEQPQPPSRSGASSTVNRDEANAFVAQFDEVERAAENLAKGGKPFGGYPPSTPQSASQVQAQPQPQPQPQSGGSRRESMPMMGAPRPYPEQHQDARYGGQQRHHSVSEYDGMRSHSASNAQGFYQNQRFAPRPNDADQMAQAKRRMAAQRERELRNYHQEQQYHRNVSGSGSKSDRSMSPNAMNEDDRRELIARQHRALYGETSALYNNNPTSSQDVRVQSAGSTRGASPLAFDPFGMQAQNAPGDASVQMPARGDKDAAVGAQEARANSNASPSSHQNPAFGLFDAQQASRTSNSSPAGSPPVPGPKANGSGVAPIGTRPAANQHQPAGASLGKRATTPLPSPLGYNAYNASEQHNVATTSSSLNPSSTITDKGAAIWNNGPWGNTSNQGVQASVWG